MAHPMIRKLALAAVATALVVIPAELNSWLDSGAMSLNGAVKPANSVLFHDIPNCSFYKNSTQTKLCDATPRPTWYRASPAML